MKKKITLSLLFIPLLFISCSNMTVGFEEDSQFYNGPLIDTREDVNATKKEESVVVQDKKEIEAKEEVIQTQESETTFSYERDDD